MPETVAHVWKGPAARGIQMSGHGDLLMTAVCNGRIQLGVHEMWVKLQRKLSDEK